MVSSDKPTASEHFPRRVRLLRGSDFDAVFAAKNSCGDGVLVLYARPNELGHPRLGLVVSRKAGKAVVRNRWKRLLRSAFRLQQHELPAMDLVCLPRAREVPTFAAASRSLGRLAGKAAERAKRRSDAS